jgi:hypothetical protein
MFAVCLQLGYLGRLAANEARAKAAVEGAKTLQQLHRVPSILPQVGAVFFAALTQQPCFPAVLEKLEN